MFTSFRQSEYTLQRIEVFTLFHHGAVGILPAAGGSEADGGVIHRLVHDRVVVLRASFFPFEPAAV